ncbi:hypothetical protein PV11_06607 [Exophiala sideris]|uniref:LIM zinc-binding domain-containing protein n=1 Tax=Exophiala sideris TaxID=1016849 RepID=A0A0D1YE54_9EURO|nr:hypothetical protein PV11_06607 [Exophiala sideris]
MFHRKSSLGTRKVSPPQPTVMTAEQKLNYLESLRSYRPARPTGSRPPPFAPRNHTLPSQTSLTRSDSEPVICSPKNDLQHDQAALKDVQPLTIHKSSSFSVPDATSKGRPLVQPPGNVGSTLRGRKVSPTATIQVPTAAEDGAYLESVCRKIEKEEAHKLREELEFIDHKDEETRLYSAAQNEAADLVWKHQNPNAAEEEKTAAYRNPDLKLNEKRRVSSHRKASGSRKVSFPNPESQIYEEPEERAQPVQKTVKPPSTELPLRVKSTNTLPWLRKKAPSKPDAAPLPDHKKYDRFEIHRNIPTQSRDAEYTANTPPRAPAIETIEEVETPKSLPALEIRGEDIRAATSMKRKDRSPNLPTPTAVSDQLGRPIVSFDRSWKPPSDSPRNSQDLDRPVVRLTESPSTQRSPERPLPRPIPAIPEVTVSAPAVPTICLPEDEPSPKPSSSVPVFSISPAPPVPTLNLPDEGPQIPQINIEGEDTYSPTIPIINAPIETIQPPRPLPRHAATAPVAVASTSTIHKTPSARIPWLNRHTIPTVSCSSCALPISGRIVTASGGSSNGVKARFHPQCFTCHHCATALECVSFYPEPEEKRLLRLEDMGIDSESPEAVNDPLRFYCHLDFHEFFSPRCRSCKTPIEGEIIVAAGAEWHVGHFFCAECGDPFDSTTPFVERDNYAYCVSCHTKRTSARCRECKQLIQDELTVEALGGKYHEHCFVCFECGGGFGDDGRFFLRDVPVEPTDKEKRRGIMSKVEEKAVCGPCEEMRLKA